MLKLKSVGVKGCGKSCRAAIARQYNLTPRTPYPKLIAAVQVKIDACKLLVEQETN
jgi:hypothetical protein